MLIHSAKVIGTAVLSLHVGGAIARTVRPIIDPRNLKIVAFIVEGPLVGRDEVGDILDVKAVREFSSLGMIINSIDDLTARADAIRIGEVLEMNFDPIGMKVVTKKGTRLGKVLDYTLEPTSFQIQQLIVQRPALKAIVDPELTISHSQVVEISDQEIIVKDEEAKIREQATRQDFIPNFVNPFREPHYAPVQNQSPDELDTK